MEIPRKKAAESTSRQVHYEDRSVNAPPVSSAAAPPPPAPPRLRRHPPRPPRLRRFPPHPPRLRRFPPHPPQLLLSPRHRPPRLLRRPHRPPRDPRSRLMSKSFPRNRKRRAQLLSHAAEEISRKPWRPRAGHPAKGRLLSRPGRAVRERRGCEEALRRLESGRGRLSGHHRFNQPRYAEARLAKHSAGPLNPIRHVLID